VPAYVSTYFNLPTSGPAFFEVTFGFNPGAGGDGTQTSVIAEVRADPVYVDLKLTNGRLQICTDAGVCSAETPVLKNIQNRANEPIDIYGTWDPVNGGTVWFTTGEATSCAPYGSLPLGKPLSKQTDVRVGCLSGAECDGNIQNAVYSLKSY
jgi:hypothetical protein